MASTTCMATPRGGAVATPRSARLSAPVPFLPGNAVYDSKVAKTDHRIPQTLAFGSGGAFQHSSKCHPALTPGRGVPKLDMTILDKMDDPKHRYDRSARPLTHDEREEARDTARNTYRPGLPPAWLQHDRHVLRFFAHFQEPVHESPKENFRVRECVICFYLEDGTMMIQEPKVENSGITQGSFVKRHRIPKDRGGYFTADDLACGTTITVYSRSFRITSCDDFTRSFYAEAKGRTPGDFEHTPLDAFRASQLQEDLQGSTARSAPREVAESRIYTELRVGGARKNEKLQQFMENDRRVLCFKCYWDDSTRYGMRLYFTLHYYLSDDSVEIHECHPRNSGRDPFPVFWKRAPVRKNPHVQSVPVLRGPEPIFYRPEDFIVGQTVNVLEREITLYDCDDFTRTFFQRYLGHEQAVLEVKEPPPTHVQLSHPPHNGFGSEDDSLGSCLRLTPRPPRKDELTILADSDKILRFSGEMVNGKREDGHRHFVICVFLADDTMSVHEASSKNSGHAEGRFAARGRKKNMGTGSWFTPQDFYVGAVVEINASPFLLTNADEATFKLMEGLKARFPVANLGAVLQKIQPLKTQLAERSALGAEELQSLAHEKVGVRLTDHELITLARACPEHEFATEDGAISVKRLTAAFESRGI